MRQDTTVLNDRDIFRPKPNRAERRKAVRQAGYGKQLSQAWTKDWRLGRLKLKGHA